MPVGAQGDRVAQVLAGLGEQQLLGEDEAAAEAGLVGGLQVAGGDRLRVVLGRADEVAERAERLAALEVGAGVAGVGLERFVEQLEGVLGAIALQAD